MNRHTPLLLMTLLVSGALAQNNAAANAPISLNLVMSLVKTVTVDGKATEQFIPSPKSVQPGDVISQVVTVQNTTSKVIKGQDVRLPVPKNTIYLAPETGLNIARAEYSIDGGKTFASAPLKRTITVTENGKSVQKEVEVKPSEYTNVRWIVGEFNPGQILKLGYRVKVK